MSEESTRARPRIGAALAAALFLSTGPAGAQGGVVEPPEDETEDELRPSEVAREVLALSPSACIERLRAASVPFERVDGPAGSALVRLTGPVAGVVFEFDGRDSIHAVLDCRLALVLHDWAPTLRRERVARVRHLSIYRPNARVRGTAHESGHAAALAIDVRFLELDDGRMLDVERDFGDTTRGAAPCDAAFLDAPDVSPIRRIVCDAAAEGRFQVIVTPHRDEAHANHVHLEIVPGVDWVYVR